MRQGQGEQRQRTYAVVQTFDCKSVLDSRGQRAPVPQAAAAFKAVSAGTTPCQCNTAAR
jgi:hypothetical protein